MAFAQAAHAQGRGAVVPGDGGKYPPGTEFTGPCQDFPPYPEKVESGTKYVGEGVTTIFYLDSLKNGWGKKVPRDVNPEGPDEDPDDDDQEVAKVEPGTEGGNDPRFNKCHTVYGSPFAPIILTGPGRYWMVVYRTKIDNVHEQFNFMTKQERMVKVERKVRFEIAEACEGGYRVTPDALRQAFAKALRDYGAGLPPEFVHVDSAGGGPGTRYSVRLSRDYKILPTERWIRTEAAKGKVKDHSQQGAKFLLLGMVQSEPASCRVRVTARVVEVETGAVRRAGKGDAGLGQTGLENALKEALDGMGVDFQP